MYFCLAFTKKLYHSASRWFLAKCLLRFLFQMGLISARGGIPRRISYLPQGSYSLNLKFSFSPWGLSIFHGGVYSAFCKQILNEMIIQNYSSSCLSIYSYSSTWRIPYFFNPRDGLMMLISAEAGLYLSWLIEVICTFLSIVT